MRHVKFVEVHSTTKQSYERRELFLLKEVKVFMSNSRIIYESRHDKRNFLYLVIFHTEPRLPWLYKYPTFVYLYLSRSWSHSLCSTIPYLKSLGKWEFQDVHVPSMDSHSRRNLKLGVQRTNGIGPRSLFDNLVNLSYRFYCTLTYWLYLVTKSLNYMYN